MILRNAEGAVISLKSWEQLNSEGLTYDNISVFHRALGSASESGEIAASGPSNLHDLITGPFFAYQNPWAWRITCAFPLFSQLNIGECHWKNLILQVTVDFIVILGLIESEFIGIF